MTLTLLLRPSPFVVPDPDPDLGYSSGARVGPTTLLGIVQRACDEMGLRRPQQVYNSSVAEPRQMLALLQAAGRDCMQYHAWATLICTATITLSPGVAVYPLPSDFDRLLDQANWDVGNSSMLMGGITPQRHAYWGSSGTVGPTTSSEYRLKVRLAANTVSIYPTPTDAGTFSFLYVRNTWVISGAYFIDEFSADTDTSVFNPQLLVKELKWRFKAAKGLDAVDLIMECNSTRDRLVAADIAPPPLDMGGLRPRDPIDYLIPDGNWPL